MEFTFLWHRDGKVWGGLVGPTNDQIFFGGTSPGQAMQSQLKKRTYISGKLLEKIRKGYTTIPIAPHSSDRALEAELWAALIDPTDLWKTSIKIMDGVADQGFHKTAFHTLRGEVPDLSEGVAMFWSRILTRIMGERGRSVSVLSDAELLGVRAMPKPTGPPSVVVRPSSENSPDWAW